MSRRLVSLVISVLLLANASVLRFNVGPARAEPATIIVPDDYLTIQEAIDAASDGDTVFVRNGTYYERLYILYKTISLIGEDWRTTIINGSAAWAVVELLGPSNITGFTICNGQVHGIYAPYHNYPLSEPEYVISIVGNAIMNNDCGLMANYSRFLIIYHNNFINNTHALSCEEPTYITWDNGCEGNYWDDYSGIDDGSGVGRFGEPRVAGDGVGDTDTPFKPSGSSSRIDWYPLTKPWTSTPAMPWDITGPTMWVPDGKCDIRDLALVASLFGSLVGDGKYDVRADVTGSTYLERDGKIDMRDVALVAIHFGEIDP